jgi:glyoxylase-like metal-dependent hydrolase (beta-lactamase superfamily II)
VRRRLLLGAAGAAGSVVLGLPWGRGSEARAQAPRAASNLRGDVHLLSVGGTNLVAMTGADGALLVDGGSAEQAAEVAALLAALPGGAAVRTLFNTCWHRTCTGSNETLARAGATIIAHENARLWLTTEVVWPWDGSRFAPLAEAARPNKTYYSVGDLDVGGRRVEYGHVRASPHTDGDTYVHFRDANVLAVGNTIAGRAWPAIDWRTGGWIGGVVGALELFLRLADADTLVVAARGPVLRRSDVVAQHEMFDQLYERLVNLLYNGKSPAEAVAARPAAELEGRFGPSDEFVARAFQSLWGYLTPDA